MTVHETKMRSDSRFNIKRKWFYPLILGLVCFMGIFFISDTYLLRLLEWKTYDLRVATRDHPLFSSFQAKTHFKNPDIVIIPVEEKTSKELDKEPTLFWSPYFGSIISALSDNDAKIVGVDFIYSISTDEYIKEKMKESFTRLIQDKGLPIEPDEIDPYLPSWDRELFIALAKRKTVLTSIMDENSREIRPYQMFSLAVGDRNIGIANAQPDSDNVVRSQFLYKTQITEDDKPSNHFVFALLNALHYMDMEIRNPGEINEENIANSFYYNPNNNTFYIGKEVLPTFYLDGKSHNLEGTKKIIINYAAPPGSFFFKDNFVEVLRRAEQKDTEYFRKNFAGKIVLIGPAYAGSLDIVHTPYNSFNYDFSGRKGPGNGRRPHLEMFGVEVHANIINTIINRDFIIPLGHGENLLILLFVAMITAFICYYMRLNLALLLTVVLGGTFIVWGFVVFYKYNLWINMASPLLALPVTLGAVYIFRYLAEEREKKYIRGILGRYISESVAQEILKDPSMLELGGKRMDVTILFSDINDFTTMSEITPPEEVITILNEYFTRMEKVVFNHKGTLKQFIGDEIMVVCGAPSPDAPDNHARQCLEIALDMDEDLKKWKEERKAQGKSVFDVKIGIHSGGVVVGNVGSPNRTEYTTIGDVVNTTARIMGLTKSLNAPILVSEDTYKRTFDFFIFQDKGTQRVKGKETEVRVYHLLGRK